MRLKLIESYLPVEELARAAAKEVRAAKSAPSSLHLWWGNRQLSIARALVFAQLVEAPTFDDLDQTRKVHEVLKGLLAGEPLAEPVARELIAESCGTEWPTVYDPMCGVGTIPFAALSLGVPALGGELNPVAAFVARLAVGTELSRIDAEDVNRAIRWTQRELEARIGANYPTIKVTKSLAQDRPELAKYVGRALPIMMWLWARTVPDPSPAFGACGVPLVSNFVTGANAGHETWVDVELLKTKKDYRFVVRSGAAPEGADTGTRLGRTADFYSIFDRRPITADYIREQGNCGKLGVRLMAIFAAGDDGEKLVLSPTKDQARVAMSALGVGGEIPLTDNVRDTKAFGFGFKTYGELFLPRQRLMLTTLGEVLVDYSAKGPRERDAAHVLALAYSQFVSWHSMCNTYWNERQFPRNVFTRQSLPFAWDFVEANPITSSLKRWEEIARGVAEKYFALPRVGGGTVRTENAVGAQVDETMVINTELPYYDNVAYADLADFFYAWLRPVLKVLEPDLAANLSSPRTEELTAFAYRHGGREKADAFYREGIARALRTMGRNCRTDYPAVFSFDFRSATFTGRDIAPVASFVEGLVSAGFTITAAWPLRDMRTKAVFGGAAGTGYRAIYFACRQGIRVGEIVTRREFVETLKRKLPEYLTYYGEIAKGGTSGEDRAAQAFVAGIRLYSQYEKVLNADGSPFPVAEVLAEVLKLVDEQKRQASVASKKLAFTRDDVIRRLTRGENADAVRAEVYSAYLKAEDEGREEAVRYTEILNEWNNLIEEINL